MAEILKIREITIDTMQHKDFNVKEEELKLIRFYQNDLNSAKLLINVTHDKVVTDFSSATSVQIAFLKPDCRRVFQDVQNVNQMQGKYYVVLSTQTLIAYGNVIAQLRFTFPNNKVIETCKFAFTVDESIMSDDAMKSTNEFPVIQKAIEAGKKLEGVDIAGIIAAGELAKGAVPKTGGTMTGNLMFDVSGGNKLVGFRRADGKQSYIYGGSDTIGVYSTINDKTPWRYVASTDTFDVNAANTNLLKKTGDTITGQLSVQIPTSGDNGLAFKDTAGKDIHKWVGTNSGAFAWQDKLGNVDVLNYSSASKTMTMRENIIFNVSGATNLMKKSDYTAKDGRASLTLTADAELIGSNGVIADRRGNTVTLRAPIRRKALSIGTAVFTLPADMRPTLTVTSNFISNDGAAGLLTIGTDGITSLTSAGATDVRGKNFNMTFTYVVD